MQAENSTNPNFGSRLKFWGKQSFKSLAKLAEILDISPQHLSAYFSGKRKPSIETLAQLHGMGADLNFLIGGSCADRATQAPSLEATPHQFPPLAIPAARAVLGGDLTLFALQLEATEQEVQAWETGAQQPSCRQLALLFNLLATASLVVAKAKAA